MPPILALVLCTGFVLFLLWLDHRQERDVSLALWIPTLWMLSSASRPLGAWLPYASGGAESQSPLDQIFLITLLCLGLTILAWRKFDWANVIKENEWLILLISFMFISIFWSEITLVSFKRWIRELVAVIMASVVLTEQDPRQAMRCLFRRTIYVLIPFSLILIKYYPEYGVMYGRWSGEQTWIGVALQKNGLGRLCMVSALYLVWTFFRRWQGRDDAVNAYQNYAEGLVFILTLWLLVQPGGAYSATAIAATVVGFSTFGILLWMKVKRITVTEHALMTIIAVIIAFGIVTVFVGGSTVGALTSTLGRDETLTGRTVAWEALIPAVLQQPIGGAGFGGFWIPETRKAYDISDGHNGYLDVLLDIGFFGLLLMTMFLLSSARRAQRELDGDFDWATLWICFLFMAVVHNIAETSLSTFTSHLTAILLFLAVANTTMTESPEDEST